MKGFGFSSILVTIAILVIFGNVILALVGDVAYGIRTGDWNKLITDVGSTIFSADSRIGDAVNQLKNPINASEVYLNYLKMQIMFALASLFIYIWIVVKVLKTIAKGHVTDLGTTMIVILFAFVLIGLAQMIYTASIGHFQMPYSGLWSLITNPQVLAGEINYVSNDYIPNMTNRSLGNIAG